MDSLYRTSRWARLHDWDWLNASCIPGQERFVRARAEQLPSQFHYHVLRLVVATGSETDASSVHVALSYIKSGPLISHILRQHATPRPLSHCESGSSLRLYGREGIRKAVAALRTLGLLVLADVDEPVDCNAVFMSAALITGILQRGEEYVPALARVAEMRPMTVLEVGTAWGGSLFGWAQVADPNALLISVDIGPDGGGYSEEYAPRLQQFCAPSQQLHCVLGDSTSSDVLARVEEILDGRSIDLLFIDGDHSYEGAKSDFDTFSQFVRPGGIVAFHDIRLSEIAQERPDVRTTWGTSVAPDAPMIDALWHELKADYRHEEYIVEAGVGLLWMD